MLLNVITSCQTITDHNKKLTTLSKLLFPLNKGSLRVWLNLQKNTLCNYRTDNTICYHINWHPTVFQRIIQTR
jgi:hypothetical protein